MRTITKRLSAFILCLILLCGTVPMTVSASTNGHSQQDAVTWCEARLGTYVGGSEQCVAFVREYYAFLGFSVSGNGKDYENNVMSGWTRTYYYSGYVPQPGDIAVWRSTNSSSGAKFGHVAVVASADASNMTIYEQGPSTGTLKKKTIGYSWYNTVTCFIHPDFNSSSNDKPINIGDDFYAYIIKLDSWKHLENAGGSYGNIQIAQSGNNSSDPKQIFHFIRQSDNSYKIVSAYDGKCIDADGMTTFNETQVHVWDDSNKQNQRWFIHSASNGGYTIRAAYCNLVFDSAGGRDTAGNNIQLYERNNTAAQVFAIYNLTNDGVHYKKPSPPDKVKVSVTNNSNGSTTFSWTTAKLNGQFDRREYDVRIYDSKGAMVYKTFGVLKTNHTVTLSSCGKYSVKVTSVNSYYYNYFTWSDEVFFQKNHSYTSKVTKAATCTANGVRTYTCSCGDSYTESIAALGHSYKSVVTPPTCTAQGYTTFTCTRSGCGHSYKSNYTNAKGHTPGEWKITKEPTTTSTGSKTLYCSDCGQAVKTETIPKLVQPQGKVHSVAINDLELNYKQTGSLNPVIKADSGTSYTVSYTSSNSDIASVDNNGNVYAAKRGSAKITVTVTDSYGNSVTDDCIVNVDYSGSQWFIIIVLFGWIWYI